MNIMRKWWGSGSHDEFEAVQCNRGSSGLITSSVGGSTNSGNAEQQQHLALGLMHLKKLFSELLYPAHPLSEGEQEDKLYNMLPLFCKVMCACPSSDILEKFPDVLLFTQHVSKLMVTEIRRRASNQSTAAASCAIVRFLEVDAASDETLDAGPSSGGWLLLNALNLLADGPPQVIEVMTGSSLPSTLVKCLYLFFDLPDPESSEAEDSNFPAVDHSNRNTDQTSSNQSSPARKITSAPSHGDEGSSEVAVESTPDASLEMTTMERRLLLQKVFVQLLVRLCSHLGPGEELARKDDLSLLFSATTSWCSSHNLCWRSSAAEVLMTLSRHSLSQPVVTYIHSKGCIALCVENMERTNDLTPLEIVEMLVALFCFLKDSADFSQTLLDDFRAAQGYAFLVDFILRLEQESIGTNSGLATPVEEHKLVTECKGMVTSCSGTLTGTDSVSSVSSSPSSMTEAHEALRNLVLLVASLTYCGHTQPRPSLHPSTAVYTLPGFVLPLPSTRGGSVRNVAAFTVLQHVFMKARSATLCSVVLDAIASVYHSDAANYFILEPQATLSSFAENIHLRTPQVQVKYFELVELVVFELNHVPCKELVSLSLTLKAHHSSHPETVSRCLTTLISVLKHHIVFKDVYREVGLLEVLVSVMGRYPRLLARMPLQLQEQHVMLPSDRGACGASSSSERVCLQAIEAVLVLLTGNTNNAAVFREAAGAGLLFALLPFPRVRIIVMSVLHQVIVVGGCEEDMTALLDVLHYPPPRLFTPVTTPAASAPSVVPPTGFEIDSEGNKNESVTQIAGLSADDKLQAQDLEHQLCLKIDILKVLIGCMRESHRSRAVFRKVNGFVRMLGIILSLKNVFGDTSSGKDGVVEPQPLVLSLLSAVFVTLTTAMRYEPANAKFFHLEICNGSLCDTLLQLGCFSASTKQIEPVSAPYWTALLTPVSLKKASPGVQSPRSHSPQHPPPPPRSPSSGSPQHHPLIAQSHMLLSAAVQGLSKPTLSLLTPSKAPEASAAADHSSSSSSSCIKQGSGSCGIDDHVVVNAFHSAFTTPLLEFRSPEWLPPNMVRSLQVIQLLYHLSLDTLDKPAAPPSFAPPATLSTATESTTTSTTTTAAFDKGTSASCTLRQADTSSAPKKPGVGPLNLNAGGVSSEVVIVHPGVVVTLLQLLPSLVQPRHARLSALLQLYTVHLIKSLVRSERNQQVMCVGGLSRLLLEMCATALLEEHHPLHPLIIYIFERLSAHSILPTELRSYLRLGDPLNCRNIESFNCNDEATFRDPVPLSRIKTIVAMTTPRHNSRGGGLSGSSTLQLAPFVEFDMSAEGFGCLFLPSLSPHAPLVGPGSLNASTAASVMSGALGTNQPVDLTVIGGIGSGDRVFPPQSGLSYSTWFSVERFSDPRTDPHCVRLLTLVRNLPGRTAHLVCLVICLSARDKALIVTTQELPLPTQGQVVQELEPPLTADYGCRVWCPDLLTEGQWHHLVVTLNKAVLKNSALSIYVDGKLVHSQKLQYITLSPGGGVANLSLPASVYGYIGSAPSYRRLSRLVWRQGVCHLIEDVLSPVSVSLLYQLGPNYTGSLQAPQLPGCDASAAIVLEDKVMLGLNAAALSHFTLNKIRKFYSKVDSKAIAKQLGMSSHENATPIRVVHNSAGHLNGPARSMGGVVIGYLGVRVFCPRPVAAIVQTLGGMTVLLGLIAMSSDVETLYASVKALSCVVRNSKSAQVWMARSSGYQTLAQLLRRKLSLLTSQILHLCLGLVLAGDHASPANHKICSSATSHALPNLHAFVDLVLDLELWCTAPGKLWKPLLEYLLELAKESPDRHSNLKIMRSLGLVSRLLHLLNTFLSCNDSPVSCSAGSSGPAQTTTSQGSTLNNNLTAQQGGVCTQVSIGSTQYSLAPASSSLLYSLLTVLLAVNPRPEDLLNYGQFIFSTLPHPSISEKEVVLDSSYSFGVQICEKDSPAASQVVGNVSVSESAPVAVAPSAVSKLQNGCVLSPSATAASAKHIALRNKCLEILHTLMYNSNKNTVHLGFCEEVTRVLGLDWVVVLSSSSLHHSTVIFALRMLVALLSCPPTLTKFREASSNGGWLSNLLANAGDGLLGYAVGVGRAGMVAACGEVREEVSGVAGFQVLTHNMTTHVRVAQAYPLLLALMLGQPVKNVPHSLRFEVSSLWSFLFGCPATELSGNVSGRAVLCPEAVITVLSMVRTMMSQCSLMPEWLKTYPETLLRFLVFLHRHNDDFVPLLLSSDVITALSLTVFPVGTDIVATPIADKKCGDIEMVVVMDSGGTETKISEGKSSPATSRFLNDHPAHADVISFLEQLVLDSLLMPPPSKPPHVIDFVLDAAPVQVNRALVVEFQTQVLSALLTRIQQGLTRSGTLEGAWIRPGGYVPAGGSIAHLPANLFYLVARMLDKLWAGTYIQDAHVLLDTIVALIACSKQQQRSTEVQCTDLIYSCLNRTVLFLLSRPCDSTTVHRAVLQALHKLTTHRVIVFGAGNHDLEFVACLTHCLLQLTAQLHISTDSSNRTVWHVNSFSPVESSTLAVETSPSGSSQLRLGALPSGPVTEEEARECVRQRDEAMARATQSHHLMVTAATRVWEELYISKKPAVEEVFKVSLPVQSSSSRAPSLENVRTQVTETAHKMWLAFIEAEKKQTYSTRMMPWDVPTHFQTVTNVSKKLQKVTGGLTRLASRSKSRRDDSIVARKAPVQMSTVDALRHTAVHVALVKELVALEHLRYQQKREDLHRYSWGVWEREERELTRERGLWGPTSAFHLDKWMLDATEGPCRMRKKMVANTLFYLHYPPSKPLTELEQGRQSKYKMACSFHSEEYYRKCRPLGLANRERPFKDDAALRSTIAHGDNGTANSFVGKDLTDVDVSGLKGHIRTAGPSTTTDAGSDIEGILASGEEEGDPSDLTDLGLGGAEQAGLPSEDSVHSPDNQTLLRLLERDEKVSHMFRCARIQGLDTTESLLLFGREHFYIVDGFTLLKTREIRDIESLPPGSHEPVIPSVSTTAPNAAVGGGGGASGDTHACSKLHYDEIREALQRRYLLQPIGIEIFSSDGRNYLLAFPKAKERNKVYQRLLVVCTGLADSAHQSVEGQRRSASVEQTGGLFSSLIGETSVTQRWVRGEISNFQYLMHLNTLAGRSYNDLMQYPIFPWVVADYESSVLDLNKPASFRDLSKPMGAQTPERLEQFKKRYREWDDPTGETPPYHYGTHYSSAMIVSSYLVRMEPFTQHFLKLQGGHFDLADRMFHSLKEAWLSASRNNMADIKELIPEFFYLPEFLVNSNKFDLGIKQSGVQLDDIILPPWAKGDPREFIRQHRAALECDRVSANLHHWIDLIFGYKQQGQAAVDAVNVFHHLFYEGNVDIYSIDDPLKQKATIGFINNFGQIPKQLFRRPHPCKKLGGQRTSIMEASPLSQATLTTPRDKVFYKHLELLRPAQAPIKEVKGVVGEIISLEKGVLAVEQNKVLIPPSFQRYLACGFADHSLRIGPYESDKALLVYEGEIEQTGEVLAAVCPNSRTVITASTDTVIRAYEIYRRQLLPKKCLYGHSDAVTCLASSSAYGVLVSGSRDKTAIIWDLARLTFVRQLTGHHAPLAACAINDSTGDIATCGGPWLHVWTINGTPIGSVNTALGAHSALQQVLCIAFTTAYEWDHDNLILTGSSDGVIRMWGLEYVQAPIDEESDNSSVNEDRPGSSGSSISQGDLFGKGGRGGGGGRKTSDNSDEDDNDRNRPEDSKRRRPSRQIDEGNQFKGSYLRKAVSESSLSEDNEEEESIAEDASDEGAVEATEENIKKITDNTASVSLRTPTDSKPRTPRSSPKTAAQLLVQCTETPSDNTEQTETENKVSDKPQVQENTQLEEPDLQALDSSSVANLTHAKLHRQEALASTGSHTSLETSGSLETAGSGSPRTLHAATVVRAVSAVETSCEANSSGLADGISAPGIDRKRMQSSKSETSLSETVAGVGISVPADAFEVITEAEVREVRDQELLSSPPGKCDVLLPGMRWVCQLVFRSKLTAHTAYDRADNMEPASVTAITVTKDHRGLLVGDARGRVFSWTVVEPSGRASNSRGRGFGGSSSNLSSGGLPTEHWVSDEVSYACTSCHLRFTVYERKHHCRNCGYVFCSKCSKFESEISRLKIFKPVRVCQKCYALLKTEKNLSS